jgi:hypothetical protein
VKVGDLVKMPPNPVYWWSEKIGIVDYYGPDIPADPCFSFRVFVSPNKYIRFSDPDFVELISEGR